MLCFDLHSGWAISLFEDTIGIAVYFIVCMRDATSGLVLMHMPAGPGEDSVDASKQVHQAPFSI